MGNSTETTLDKMSKDEIFKSINPMKYFRDHLDQNIRPDGRKFTEFRPTMINVDCVKTADGSAIVKVGATTVICGIKAELAEPENTDPDKGFIVPNIDVSKLCSSKYRAMGVSTESQVLSQTLLNLIYSSSCIDLKDLCIAKGKLVWTLYCDLICLDDNGSLIDVATAALMTALRSVKLPKVTYDTDARTTEVDIKTRTPLNMKCTPITSTFITFEGKYLLVDPTADEEELAEKFVNVTISNDEICYVNQPGGAPLESDQFNLILKQAKSREKYVKSLIENITRQ